MDRLVDGVWTPSPNELTSVVIDLNEADIQRLELSSSNSENRIERLRATMIGRFYIKHLKKVWFIRWAVLTIWRNGYPLYANIQAFFSESEIRKWRKLISHGDYIRRRGEDAKILMGFEVVNTPMPDVIPGHEKNHLISPHAVYKYPEIYKFDINNAVVCGASNLIFVGEEVLHHDLYDFKRDYTSEELHGRIVFNQGLDKLRWLSRDKLPGIIPVAATFLDSCASNYAHWLTEVLPRIAIFCSDESSINVPLLINDGLHPNLVESIRLVAGTSRKIIMLPAGRAVTVQKLYVCSVAGYVPFERRDSKLENHSHGLFSPYALSIIRKCANSVIDAYTDNWPDKIIIRRRTGARLVKNFSVLESALIRSGFKVVETDRLSFIEQVALFSRAKVIVGSSGAALANLVFAPQDAQIFILISKLEGTSYWYWQNIACATGKTITYVLGNIASGDKTIHADFAINVSEFICSLKVRGIISENFEENKEPSMNIEKCEVMSLPRINDPRGNLTYVEAGRHIPFDIKRVYYLYDVPGGAERGGHAHRQLHQLIIAMSGSFDIHLDDGYEKKTVHLNRSYSGLYVCPMIWREIDNFSSGAVCMVLASDYYDEDDYYRNYEEFVLDAKPPIV